MSDGIGDVSEALQTRGRNSVNGYCFYHGQDLERAIAGGGLMLAFGDLDDDKGGKKEIGLSVREVLERFEFTVEWDGDPEKRVNISDIDWKRRSAGH